MIIPLLVEHRGFEPLTPTLPVWCAPSCANAPKCNNMKLYYHRFGEYATKTYTTSGITYVKGSTTFLRYKIKQIVFKNFFEYDILETGKLLRRLNR